MFFKDGSAIEYFTRYNGGYCFMKLLCGKYEILCLFI